MLDDRDRLLVNRLQDGFPLSPAPFAEVASELGWCEDEVLGRLRRLLDTGVLSRFGPMFHAERLGGDLVLAAMHVPPPIFDAIAERVNAHPEVAHNYAREHHLNMWFVVATEEAGDAAQVFARIEADTGLKVYPMPKEREYFVHLRLEA